MHCLYVDHRLDCFSKAEVLFNNLQLTESHIPAATRFLISPIAGNIISFHSVINCRFNLIYVIMRRSVAALIGVSLSHYIGYSDDLSMNILLFTNMQIAIFTLIL